MRSCLPSKVNDNSPPLYASNGISAIGSFCKDGICPCPTRGISIIMESSAVFPKNQLLFLVCFICFLCLVCLLRVGKQKDVRHRSNGVNAFQRLLLPPPTGRSPSLEEGGLGLRRSRPAALPSIAYRGFAVAPMTLRAPSRRFLYNSGCRVATLLVSMGVMGFLGDLRGRNSKSPPNPLGLAERVPSSADDDSPTFPKATFIL